MLKHRGFTLIELLVVIAIMAVLLSLVAPYGRETLDRLNASDEWYQLVLTARQQQQKAFLTMQPVVLELEGKKMVIYYRGQQTKHQFSQLSFKPQRITFSANGFPDHPILTASERKKPRQLKLLPESSLITGSTQV